MFRIQGSCFFKISIRMLLLGHHSLVAELEQAAAVAMDIPLNILWKLLSHWSSTVCIEY